jgi:hypothetical protein
MSCAKQRWIGCAIFYGCIMIYAEIVKNNNYIDLNDLPAVP